MKKAESGLNTEQVSATELKELENQARQAVCEFLDMAKLKEGQILVTGCSTSEIAGSRIGSFSGKEIGEAVYRAIASECQKRGLFLAAQCCEHLNRALIMEEKAANAYGYEIVNVVPQLKAGGSFATAAWAGMEHPVAVEKIAAHGGIDIGDTLIGMHLKAVAVPVRIPTPQIGAAHVVCARVRPKFVGGIRACYDETLL
ncbi:MAG: TIGR01440 family protein [Eubacteriales bacterium]|nr:TIGR01440 family protein [Eubacteriales bacterium]